MHVTKRWRGKWPADCDFCKTDLSKQEKFIDGRTIHGPWALMCPSCHDLKGVGLGTGKGQKYHSETMEKLEG
jgi:hypothetical protein